MRHFLFFVATVAFIIFSYGFLSPLLISYPDTTVVLGGLLYAAVIAPIVIWSSVVVYVKSAIKKLKGEK